MDHDADIKRHDHVDRKREVTMAGQIGIVPKDKPVTVTVMGATLTIDPAMFDDLDVLEALSDIQAATDGDTSGRGALAVIPLLRKILGPDGYRQMKKALTDPKTGRIPVEKVGQFLSQVMEQAAPNS